MTFHSSPTLDSKFPMEGDHCVYFVPLCAPNTQYSIGYVLDAQPQELGMGKGCLA